mgnify:CR=1 FL=1
MANQPQQGQKKENAPSIKDQTVNQVMSMVREIQSRGELMLPPDYDPQKALQSAWLIIQQTVDKNNNPVLSVCTTASIAQSLYDMVLQGLDPNKDQCYFMAYGKQLTCFKSYFGAQAVAKRVDDRAHDFNAQVVYEGDEFEYEIKRGVYYITKHTQKLGNQNNPIIGAYCEVLDKNGEPFRTEIMTYEQIKKSWSKSQQKPVNDDGSLKQNSAHAKQPEEFAKRTVINRVAKPIINSTTDQQLYQAHAKEDVVAAEQEALEEEQENANQEAIDIAPSEDVEQSDVGPVEHSSEPEQEAEAQSQNGQVDDKAGF